MKIEFIKKYRKLGLNINYYRRDRGYTQQQLADLVGVERAHLQKIETANAGVSLDTIFKLAEVLELPEYKLFEFRD